MTTAKKSYWQGVKVSTFEKEAEGKGGKMQKTILLLAGLLVIAVPLVFLGNPGEFEKQAVTTTLAILGTAILMPLFYKGKKKAVLMTMVILLLVPSGVFVWGVVKLGLRNTLVIFGQELVLLVITATTFAAIWFWYDHNRSKEKAD